MKNTKLTLTVVLVIAGAIDAQQKFEKGILEDLPLSAATPTTINSTQLTPHTKITPIQGTLQANYRTYVWSSGGQVDFQIFFRDLEDSTYKDSLIVEFSVPFATNVEYQNKRILYSADAKEEKFKIKQKDIKIYEMEKDFHVLKGDEITEDVNLRTFETTIYVEKVVSSNYSNRRRRRRVRYKTFVQHFDLYYERGSQLHRMMIQSQALESNWWMRAFTIFVLVLNVVLIVFVLQNLLAYLISKKLFERNESWQYLATFLTSGFAPLYLLGLIKHMNGWLDYLILFVIILLLCGQNIMKYSHLADLLKKDSFEARTIALGGIVAALNIGWIIALFFQPWLLFRSYFFYAGIFLIDLIILGIQTYMDKCEIFSCSLMAALRGFLTQLFFYNCYALLFCEAHAELPEIWKPFVLIDLWLLLAFLVISAVVAVLLGSSRTPHTPFEGEMIDYQ